MRKQLGALALAALTVVGGLGGVEFVNEAGVVAPARLRKSTEKATGR